MDTGIKEYATIVQIIQLILAPAVMINACGLLLLSTSNKYSLVLNRIRLLNDEKRKLFKRAGEKSFEETQRLESLAQQINRLIVRGKLVRNSVLCYSVAVGLFVLTSLLIGISFFAEALRSQGFIIGTFLVGMVSVFSGVVFSFLDAKRGYDIVLFDVKAEE